MGELEDVRVSTPRDPSQPNATLRELERNWVTIVLTVVGIVQGLAFSDLARRAPVIIRDAWHTEQVAPFTHLLFCLAILIRVLQTYVTAALDYRRWRVGVVDLLSIFLIGFVEFYIFGTLGVARDGSVSVSFTAFYGGLTLLSFIGICAYAKVLFRLHLADGIPGFPHRRRDRRLQLTNIGGLVILLAMSVTYLLLGEMSDCLTSWFGAVGALVLYVNTSRSLFITFSEDQESPDITSATQQSKSEPEPPAGPRINA